MVSIPGGEPLLHPQIDKIVEGLVARKKYVYLCTNALLLKEKLHLFTPSKYLSFSVHLDGEREHHDFSVCREGGYDIAMEGIKAALSRAVSASRRTPRSSTAPTPTACAGILRRSDDGRRRGHDAGAWLLLRQGAGPEAFPGRARTRRLFRAILSNRKKSWKFNASRCSSNSSWGSGTLSALRGGCRRYSIFGWQKPCYLLQDGYADTFQELIESTNGELRDRIGQSEMRELHGALRLRRDGGQLHVRLAQGAVADGEGHDEPLR